ncbi:hypothetical protein PROFUN_07900 [Planoprotostelium fungivorum]|uniref:Uncharacterized protein n=1 Tax=Planoprotostelium fungivorum TaxID=1890364 RepID=A0A2P6NL17_9EUKA|nr:hypothetical protein PROFUN_07900 [Planoprotostelium fungivorum]
MTELARRRLYRAEAMKTKEVLHHEYLCFGVPSPRCDQPQKRVRTSLSAK